MKIEIIFFSIIFFIGFVGNSYAQYMGDDNSSDSLEERIGVGLTRDITWPPPIKQIKLFDFEPENVKCNSGLELIFKIDNSPACVKPESIPKLIERGWTKDESERGISYQKHDVVVHVDLLSYSFDDEYGFMMVRVVEFLKNPQNASHLTIWGNFNEFKEYCSANDCDHAIAYLYEDENGFYHKGDYWEWIDSDKPTIVEKTIECYKMFHCESYGLNATSSCLHSKINGTIIKEICANADVTIDHGCVSVSYQDNVKMMSCE